MTPFRAYPPPPAHYRNVTLQLVPFRAAPAAVQRVLPGPLTADPQGGCMAAGIDVGFCTSYGSFQEAFLMLGCRFRDEAGWFCSHVLHNGPAGIAAGREIYGTPKVFARVTVRRHGRTMVTEAHLDGVPVMRVASTADQVVPPDALPALAPSWRLKVIPRADGPGPALRQLIDCSATMQDLAVRFSARGRGTVTLGAAPDCDLTALAPASCGAAGYLECDYTEGYAAIAHDYLA